MSDEGHHPKRLAVATGTPTTRELIKLCKQHGVVYSSPRSQGGGMFTQAQMAAALTAAGADFSAGDSEIVPVASASAGGVPPVAAPASVPAEEIPDNAATFDSQNNATLYSILLSISGPWPGAGWRWGRGVAPLAHHLGPLAFHIVEGS